MLSRGLLLAALALVAGITPAAAKVTREDYVSPLTADAVNECRDENPSGMNIGAACLDITGGKLLNIAVEDQAFGPVGFYWAFTDADGDCALTSQDPVLGEVCESNGFACGSLATTSPPRTARVKLSLDGPAFWAANCAPDAGPATVGTVVFTH